MSGYFKALLFLACALPVSSDGPLFTDVTQAAGISFVNQSGGADKQHIIETQSAGGGFWDYDLDGQLDIFLTSGIRPDSTTGTALYRGMGRGAFSDATEGSGTELSGWNMGVALADPTAPTATTEVTWSTSRWRPARHIAATDVPKPVWAWPWPTLTTTYEWTFS